MTVAIKRPDQSRNRPPTRLAKTPLAGNPFVERRKEAGYPTCEQVEVCILEMANRRLKAVLREVSRNGLRIEVGIPVNAGARFQIVWGNRANIFGEARYFPLQPRSLSSRDCD
jgi:hypothetical protein